MAEFVVMPKLGFDMNEGVLVSWSKGAGDAVKNGEVIAEIESDKATLELEAQVSGTLLKLIAQEGDVVPIGGHLAIIGQEGEDISAMAEPGVVAEESPSALEATQTAPSAQLPSEVSIEEGTADLDYPGGVKASPVARRLAQEQGVDLSNLNGSGPGGRIVRADVEEFVKKGVPAPAISEGQVPVAAGVESREVPTTRLRLAIGKRMVQSKTTVPHFYVTTEVDMAPALALRKEINALLPDEKKVTVNDMIVKAAALTLRKYPNLNASFAGDKVILHGEINVGSAVAIEGGLLTVVQKNTDMSPIAQVAEDNKAMIGRARAGKSRPSDFESGTFTISNLGAFEVDHFIAIINPPEAAILAVGTAQQVPVVVDGELTVGWRMKATISADHRVTDGAEAAEFMQQFKACLEEPLQLLL